MLTLFSIIVAEASDKCFTASHSQELIDETLLIDFRLQSDLLRQIDTLLGLVESVSCRPLPNTFYGCGANALCASLFNSSDLQKHQNVMFNSRFVIPVEQY